MLPQYLQKQKWVSLLIGLGALCAMAAVLLPWRHWVEERLVTMLEAQGFQNVHLTVSTLGIRGIVLNDISVGSDTPLKLGNITIDYSLSDLWQGHINDLVVKGLNLEAHQNQNQWAIPGLENWSHDTKENARASIPVTFDKLSAIPLDSIKLEDSSLHIASSQWQMDIPIQLAWQKTPVPKLTFQASSLRFAQHELETTSGETALEATLNESDKKWDGSWQIKNIVIKNGGFPIPVIEGKGVLTAQADNVFLAGQLKSADNGYRADFNVTYALNVPEKSLFTLVDATLPWNGGTLSAHDVRMQLAGKHATNFTLEVQHVSIDALMQILTGDRATATGTVSGTLPITIGEDGSVIFHQGNLKAENPGTIVMKPEAIPGDNEQVTLVREILKNLHYTNLSIEVNSGKGNALSVLLTLEGNNPDVYEGRPVKLNVHLTGDVLNLIQQSVLPFTNPTQFLQ